MNAAFAHHDGARTAPALGDPSAELVLAADPDAPRAARKAVRDLCSGRDKGCIADAELVVSELVTNAVRHAGGDSVAVSLWKDWRTIDGLVFDCGSGFTPRPDADLDTPVGGRGMGIVDALTRSWGSSGEGAPSSVWFRSPMPSLTTFADLDGRATAVPA